MTNVIRFMLCVYLRGVDTAAPRRGKERVEIEDGTVAFFLESEKQFTQPNSCRPEQPPAPRAGPQWVIWLEHRGGTKYKYTYQYGEEYRDKRMMAHPRLCVPRQGAG